MSLKSTDSPSMVRTGAKAGVAFASSFAMGFATALVLGGGVFFYYLSRLSGPGMSAGAHAGGAGAALAFVFSPPLLVSMLLLAFVPIYLMLGVARGRSRALQQVVMGHGDAIAQRLGDVIASRIETMSTSKATLERVSQLLSADTVGQQLAPLLGQGRAVRGMINFIINRLPLADLMTEWQKGRVAGGGASPALGQADPALRALITRRIDETLRAAATPSRQPLYIAIAVQAAVLAFGVWLTS